MSQVKGSKNKYERFYDQAPEKQDNVRRDGEPDGESDGEPGGEQNTNDPNSGHNSSLQPQDLRNVNDAYRHSSNIASTEINSQINSSLCGNYNSQVIQKTSPTRPYIPKNGYANPPMQNCDNPDSTTTSNHSDLPKLTPQLKQLEQLKQQIMNCKRRRKLVETQLDECEGRIECWKKKLDDTKIKPGKCTRNLKRLGKELYDELEQLNERWDALTLRINIKSQQRAEVNSKRIASQLETETHLEKKKKEILKQGKSQADQFEEKSVTVYNGQKIRDFLSFLHLLKKEVKPKFMSQIQKTCEEEIKNQDNNFVRILNELPDIACKRLVLLKIILKLIDKDEQINAIRYSNLLDEITEE